MCQEEHLNRLTQPRKNKTGTIYEKEKWKRFTEEKVAVKNMAKFNHTSSRHSCDNKSHTSIQLLLKKSIKWHHMYLKTINNTMIIFLPSFTTKLHALDIIYYSLDHCLTLMALTCVFPMNEEDTVCKNKN